jgi:hypothetical protein
LHSYLLLSPTSFLKCFILHLDNFFIHYFIADFLYLFSGGTITVNLTIQNSNLVVLSKLESLNSRLKLAQMTVRSFTLRLMMVLANLGFHFWYTGSINTKHSRLFSKNSIQLTFQDFHTSSA